MERSRRSRGGPSKASESLAKIREARLTGTSAQYDVGEVDGIFENVDEEQFENIRDKRAEDFIVGDDRGYYDNGEEFYDNSDDEKKLTKDEKKLKQDVTKKKKFAQGSKNITSMFLASKKKKKTKVDVKINDDDELNSILNEVDVGTPMAVPRKTPKLKKKKKMTMSMGASSESQSGGGSHKKRIMRDTPRPAPKKMKMENTTSAPPPQMIDEADDDEFEAPPPDDDDFDDDIDVTPTNPTVKEEPLSQETPKMVEQVAKLSVKNDVEVKEEFDDDLMEIPKSFNTDVKEETYDFGENSENLVFYWLDAYESQWSRDGKIYLTGRTKDGASCCLGVTNLPHVVYFLPRDGVEVGKVHAEVEELFDAKKIKTFKSRPETRKNYFVKGVPVDATYLRVEYDAQYAQLEKKLSGSTFSKIFGIGQSGFELFCLERQIKGPCWLSVASFDKMEVARVSWCKEEYTCAKFKSISIHAKNATLEPPKLTLACLTLKSSPKRSTNQLVAFSILINEKFKLNEITAGMPSVNRHIHGVSRLDGMTYPYDWNTKAMKETHNLECCLNEKQLINYLLNSLRTVDPDIIVGHDLLEFGFEFLLQRIRINGVSNWSRLGRIRRKEVPQGKNARAGFSAASGRLVCDVKISAKELIRMKDYDLTALSAEQINKHDKQTERYARRREFGPDDIAKAYEKTNKLKQFTGEVRLDAYRCLLIVNKIQAIPLAFQITQICGNIMSRTLQGGRAERNSFLLLHAFHKEGHLPPEKLTWKDRKAMDADNLDETTTKGNEKKKGPKYAGGLVLEPKKGLYTNYILLLDFNSLYPSIIQEYNLCFTTTDIFPPIGEVSDDWLPSVPPPQDDGILPRQIRALVERRREVKKLMKGERDETEYSRLNIRQLGLKLTANSMYGCLGFSASRFFAQPLAALITAKGREILKQTQDFVAKMGLEVVYGDTDSIMINSNSDDYKHVMQLGNKIKKEINKHYRLLEIDIDGAYKSLLLLKKKKYAALAVEKKGDEIITKTEFKGLDIVRRDWSNLARKVGTTVLEILLTETDQDVSLPRIQNHLELVGRKIREDAYQLNDYIIHKALTKAPEMYPKKGEGQPHVMTALRMNTNNPGKYKAGDTVTYVICKDNSDKKATERAYHPSEIKAPGSALKVDDEYYFKQQLIPVLSRLLDPIDGIDDQMIAECFGLDPKDFRSKAAQRARIEREAENVLVAMAKVEDKLINCDPLDVKIDGTPIELSIDFIPPFDPASVHPEKRDYIVAQLRKNIRAAVNKFYANWMKCTTEACAYRTRNLLHIFGNKAEMICPACDDSTLRQEYPASDLYLQLKYYERLFSFEKWHQKLENERKEQGADKEEKTHQIVALQSSQAVYDTCARIVQAYMSNSAFNRVNISSIFAEFR